jgi:uncharacterized membrane protein
MTATYAPSPWPSPTGAPHGTAWLFGREVPLSSEPGAATGLQWLLKRNCSLAPRQLGAVYAALCGLSMAIAGFFYVQGVTMILAFAGLELALLGAALLVFARHAGDRETLTLVGRSLLVEQCNGVRVQRTDFSADWLTVEPAAGQGSLVQLSGHGHKVKVGRFLRPELRAAFARELRLALRRAPAPIHTN